jgi:hypothetical protein
MRFSSIIYLGLLVIATMTSCKKEEAAACTPPALAKNIIGTWTGSAAVLGQTTSGKVTFNADGTVLDPNNFLIEGSINGQSLTTKTWTVSSNEKELTVTASKSGVGSLSETYDIKSQACSTIEATAFGGLATVKFTR